MRNLGLVVVGLALVGCSSNNNSDATDGGVTATASGVFPASGFAGRDLRVEITGDATNWTGSATVSFGAGVTVSSVTAASPTDLFANISIDPTATPGMQDVTVMANGATFTLKQAFEITAPMAIIYQGLIAQGGVTTFTIQNFDTSNPFDTTTGQDDAGNTIFPNISIMGPSGTDFEPSAVSDFIMSGVVLIDTDAAAGGAISLASGPAGGTIVTSAVGSVTVMARTATVLTPGTAATGNVANAYDSALYSFAPGATTPDVEALTLTTANAGASPAVAVLPPNGHFAGLISFGPGFDAINTTTPGLDEYLVYWDNTGTSGYSYTIEEDDTVLTHSTALTATEDAVATAATLTLPAVATAGSVNTATGSQFMKFTVAAGSVGKTIRVITTGGASPEVVVYASAADATTGNTAAFDDCAGATDCTTPAITTAGTYYLEVDANFFAVGTDYTAAVYFK